MSFLAGRGYRCIAYDRRGYGRSIEQTCTGNDINTYTDDLLPLVEHLDIKNAVMIGLVKALRLASASGAMVIDQAGKGLEQGHEEA